MKYKYNDGGRKDAGFKGAAGDCVVRAIAIATDKPYRKVRKNLAELYKDMTGGLDTLTGGVCIPISHKYLIDRGWCLTLTPNTYLNGLPKDITLIAVTARHDFAIINGTVHDTWDSRVSNRTKNGEPKIKGYYYKGWL